MDNMTKVCVALGVVAVLLSGSALGIALTNNNSINNSSGEPIVKVCTVSYDTTATLKNTYKLTLYCENITREGAVYYEYSHSYIDPDGGGVHSINIHPKDGVFFVTVTINVTINYLNPENIVIKEFRFK